MMTELVLVEGASDVLLISYYLQNVYGWKHEKNNSLAIVPLNNYEHIENLSKNGNQLILCGVGGSGKFAHFVDDHRINNIIIDENISSIMVVTDRDEASDTKVKKAINAALKNISVEVGSWKNNAILDLYGQPKEINTYLLIIPTNEKGALERVIINALKDISEEKDLIKEVVKFIDSLKERVVPELQQTNKANKATVGTFFSVKYPQNAMRFFSISISKIDWSKSESLRKLFLPFASLGKEKSL